MNGFGVSALLFGWLGHWPRPERDAPAQAASLRRLGWMLLAQCVLFLGLTLAVRFPHLLG